VKNQVESVLLTLDFKKLNS